MVFIGEPDRPENLMGDGGSLASGFAGANLGAGYRKHHVIPAIERPAGVPGSHLGRRGFPGEHSELLLDRLKLPDRATELHPLPGIGDAQGQHLGDGTGHLAGPHQRPDHPHIPRMGRAVLRQRDPVPRVPPDIAVRRDPHRCDVMNRETPFIRGKKNLHRLPGPGHSRAIISKAQRTCGHIQTGSGEQPARADGLGQRHRGRMTSSRGQNHESVFPVSADPVLFGGHQHPIEPIGGDLVPQRGRPGPGFGGVHDG